MEDTGELIAEVVRVLLFATATTLHQVKPGNDVLVFPLMKRGRKVYNNRR